MSTPYYSDDYVTLYHGDCREITEWLAADVLVTDPPYGMKYESNRNRDKRNLKVGRPVSGDATTEQRDAALAAWGNRAALIFGKWTIPRPDGTRARLIWDKRVQGTGDLSIPWGPAEEEIYVLGAGFVGQRRSNVLSVQMLMSNDAARPAHPTPKPVPLMELLVSHTVGTVADPFAGSGPTLVAASLLRRPCVGIEIEERYCEITARRLDQGRPRLRCCLVSARRWDDHRPRAVRWIPGDPSMWRTACTCGWSASWPVDGERPTDAHHSRHAAEARRQAREDRERSHRDWYTRTGHCGACAQPGGWCQCTDRDPCGCRDLHPMGSGVGRAAADVFTDAAVGADQGELFA